MGYTRLIKDLALGTKDRDWYQMGKSLLKNRLKQLEYDGII